jgi:hypothetical protein
MKVSSINSNVEFSSKIKKTEKGNEYKSTNVAKIVLPALSTASILADKMLGQKLNLPAAVLGLGISTGLGFLWDHYVDKTRKDDADVFAQTSEVKKKTHKGLGLGTAIGAGYGLIYSLAIMAISKTKSAKPLLLNIPIFTLGGLIEGALFYDLRVNKTRKQLAQKVEIKKQVEQEIKEAENKKPETANN